MRNDTQDVEMASTRKFLCGYPESAAFIASDPDNTTAIYRSFQRLSARNLLYLESELIQLEAEQDKFDEEDLHCNDITAKLCARSWQKLNETAELPGKEREQKRLRLVEGIRNKLKEYHRALVLERDVLNLRSPDSRTLKAVRNWFDDADHIDGERVPKLGGLSQHRLTNGEDLIALNGPMNQDRLAKFFQSHLSLAFQVQIRAACGSKAYISDYKINRVVALIHVLLAAAFLIGPIVGLYNVTDPTWRLWMIGILTVAFASSVGLLTNARRSEVFGTTAA